MGASLSRSLLPAHVLHAMQCTPALTPTYNSNGLAMAALTMCVAATVSSSL